SLFFYFLELNYSLFIGVFAGFFSFIPLIGIIFSFLITSILAYLQFVDPIYIIYIFIVFVVGQLLESNFLTPRLIGDKLGLHPLAVILSIFIFGALFGIIGVIFSIPITAIILLVLRKSILNK
ncbi:AI-2E family transporter, partial [Alphaproteobacteria bacterium]|nr:AI-2E family transporter [Alphaproteobacteria bacterium]